MYIKANYAKWHIKYDTTIDIFFFFLKAIY